VPVSDVTQPNPYLKHPKRDLLTTDGMQLTMVNPAYMTRQLAEIAEQADGVKFHITSLKTIRPANAADPGKPRRSSCSSKAAAKCWRSRTSAACWCIATWRPCSSSSPA
jgi:hypothetical protein